jgi:hypothetical protein
VEYVPGEHVSDVFRRSVDVGELDRRPQPRNRLGGPRRVVDVMAQVNRYLGQDTVAPG